MGSIKEYMKKYDKNISNIAIDAFETGHDLLLFSHINKKYSNYGIINSIEDIVKIKNDLLRYIKETNNIERYRKSLKKVLILKAKIQKKYGYNVKDLFENKINSWRVRKSFKEIEHDQKEKLSEKKIKSIKDFSNKAILENATLIHSKKDLKRFINLESNSNIGIYCKDKEKKIFKKLLKNKTKNLLFLKESTFSKTRDTIINKIKKTDFTIFIVSDTNSRNILDHINIYKKNLSKKMIIFVLSYPVILKDSNIDTFHIISLGTEHREVYNIIFKVLMENVQLKDISNYPVKIGKNGRFHPLYDVNWIKKNKNINIKYNKNTLVKEDKMIELLKNKNIKLKNDNEKLKNDNEKLKKSLKHILSYSSSIYWLFSYIIIIIVLLVLDILGRNENESSFTSVLINEYSFISTLIKNRSLFAIIIFSIFIVCYIYNTNNELRKNSMIEQAVLLVKKTTNELIRKELQK